MKLRISKEGKDFIVEDPTKTGSPPVGRGRTMMEAVGSYVHYNQREMGIEFEIHESAWEAELRRRTRELKKR